MQNVAGGSTGIAAYLIEEFDHTNVFGPHQDAEELLRAGYALARETFPAMASDVHLLSDAH